MVQWFRQGQTKTSAPRNLFLALLFVGVSLAQAPAQDATAIKGQRVFSCGHSFHYFMPNILKEITKASGIADHEQVGLSAIGGSRVYQHWNVPDEKNKAKEALKAGKVDVLTLSPIHLPDDGIEKFATLAFENNPKIRVTVQEFWLPFDIYDVTFTKRPAKVDHEALTIEELRKLHAPYFKSMDEHVVELNKKLGEQVIYIVPVGQAVLALRERILAGNVPGLKKQSDLFTDPIGHASPPLQALVNYCHYASIYQRSPVGLPAPAMLKKYDADLPKVLQELAWAAVTEHPLSGVKAGAKAEKTGETLFEATPLTKPGEFTPGIEGPNCDAAGNVYAVNFAKEGTIGKVTPEGKGELWVTLPGKSVGNGIVFDRKGFLFVADYTGHNVLKIDPKTKKISVFAHNDQMNQPNDLAIAEDGTLYASDPNWKEKTGQLWRIDLDGTVKRLAENMGTTNGIDLSPDGKTLYVNESEQRNVWSFKINKEGLSDKKLIKKFPDFGFDGMRCDVDGNLYITRYGKGTVVKMAPDGTILKEISVLGKQPSNICFGGPDGRTVYVTEVEHTRLVQFRVDRPGLAWSRWQQK